VSAAEAFLLKLTKSALEGDGAAARASFDIIGQAKQRQSAERTEVRPFVVQFVRVGSVTSALESLRMVKKLDPYRKTARMALEPWLVGAALAPPSRSARSR
jgi:hypothetical protein